MGAASPPAGEPCESCGRPVLFDPDVGWLENIFGGPDPWWGRHTPSRCRDAARGEPFLKTQELSQSEVREIFREAEANGTAGDHGGDDA